MKQLKLQRLVGRERPNGTVKPPLYFQYVCRMGRGISDPRVTIGLAP